MLITQEATQVAKNNIGYPPQAADEYRHVLLVYIARNSIAP